LFGLSLQIIMIQRLQVAMYDPLVVGRTYTRADSPPSIPMPFSRL
jgi:hypothetical protein